MVNVYPPAVFDVCVRVSVRVRVRGPYIHDLSFGELFAFPWRSVGSSIHIYILLRPSYSSTPFPSDRSPRPPNCAVFHSFAFFFPLSFSTFPRRHLCLCVFFSPSFRRLNKRARRDRPPPPTWLSPGQKRFPAPGQIDPFPGVRGYSREQGCGRKRREALC